MSSINLHASENNQHDILSGLSPQAATTLLKESGSNIRGLEFPTREERQSALAQEDLARCLKHAIRHGRCSVEEALIVLVYRQFNLLLGIEEAVCDKLDKKRLPTF